MKTEIILERKGKWEGCTALLHSPPEKLLKDWEYKIPFPVFVVSSSPVKLLKSLTWWCWGTCLSMHFYEHPRERRNLGEWFSGALTSHRGTKYAATTRSNQRDRQIANVVCAKVIHAGGQCRCQMRVWISHSPVHSQCCVPQKRGHQPNWR